jgi:hypothetical protein
MDPNKISGRNREQLESLPPEKRAKVAEALARIQSPERRAQMQAEREILDQEVRETGRIATRGDTSISDQSDSALRLMETLKSARIEANITMTEVSRRSGIDLAALSRIESGIQANYTIATAQRYAKAIGKRLDWVLEDEEG